MVNQYLKSYRFSLKIYKNSKVLQCSLILAMFSILYFTLTSVPIIGFAYYVIIVKEMLKRSDKISHVQGTTVRSGYDHQQMGSTDIAGLGWVLGEEIQG